MSRMTNAYDELIEKVTRWFDYNVITLVAVIIYKILLDVIYCVYIGDSYSFFSVNISVINIINGWIITLIMSYFINEFCKQECCSSVFLIILNIIYFIPITTYCGYGGGSSSFLFGAIIYWLFLSILQCRIPIITIRTKCRYVISLDKFFSILIILSSVVIIYLWAKYTNFRLLTSFFDVYDARSEAAEYDLPMVLSYLQQLLSIIIPILILLALMKRKYVTLLWLLVLTYINFSFAGHKSVIFFPVLLIGGYLFYRRKMVRLIIPGAIALEVAAFIEQWFGSIYITSYIFRRQGLVLAQLSECYYRFFLNHPTDLFRSGIMGKLGFDSVYNQQLGRVIGNNFETQVVNCNNGLLADVWANMGWIGLIIMPIIFIVCLRLWDCVSFKIEMRVTISLVLYYAMQFANSSWSTVLLSHGFIIMCLILLIFPKAKTDSVLVAKE